jgi:hypothetical protein
MRLEETGRPPSITGPTARVAMPACAPHSRSTATLPPRPLPKVKSSPVTTPQAPMCCPSSLSTKSSAVVSASSRPKWNTSIASAPAAANSSCRWSRLFSRNGGTCGAKWRTGCGSNVATIAGCPCSHAHSTASRTTAWWPR